MAVQQTTVDSRKRIQALEKQLKVKEKTLDDLKQELSQWKAEAMDLREQVAATTGSSKKIVESVMRESRVLKERIQRLEEELRQAKIDLKFSSLTGSKSGWGKHIDHGATRSPGAINANGDEGSGGSDMFAHTSFVPVTSTQELMGNNRYVKLANTRRDLNESIVAEDEERLAALVDLAIDQELELESKVGKTVLQLLALRRYDAKRKGLEAELTNLRAEVNRLQGIEKANSLRNATTAMGMALESEQESRSEIERNWTKKRGRNTTLRMSWRVIGNIQPLNRQK